MDYIIGTPDTGVKVGRTGSMNEAITIARKHGLDPTNNIFTLAAWVALRQKAHDAAVTMTGEAGTVSAAAVERQNAVNAALDRAAGGKWAHTDPVFARGSRVNETGVRNFDLEGRRLADAGPLEDNARAVRDRITAENRRAVPFNIADVRLSWYDNGAFGLKRVSTGGRIPITERTLRGLMSYWPEVFGKVAPAILADYSDGGFKTEESCEQFNRFLVDRLIPTLGKGRAASTSGDLLLWMRDQEAGVQAFHVSSTRHTSQGFDGAAFLDVLAEVTDGAGYKGEVEYDPAVGNVKFAGWMMPNHVVDLSAGDVFKFGIGGSTSDTNQGGYDVYLAAVRNLCLNLIILANEQHRVYWASHIARAGVVRTEFTRALRNADASADEIRRVWGIMRKPMPAFDASAENVLAVMRAIRAESGLPARLPSGVRTEDRLVEAFNVEPGNAYSDVLNALSRLHFEKELDRFQVARASGALVPVLVKLAERDRAIVEV